MLLFVLAYQNYIYNHKGKLLWRWVLVALNRSRCQASEVYDCRGTKLGVFKEYVVSLSLFFIWLDFFITAPKSRISFIKQVSKLYRFKTTSSITLYMLISPWVNPSTAYTPSLSGTLSEAVLFGRNASLLQILSHTLFPTWPLMYTAMPENARKAHPREAAVAYALTTENFIWKKITGSQEVLYMHCSFGFHVV